MRVYLEYAHVCSCIWKPEEGVLCSEAGLTEARGALDVGAGNQIYPLKEQRLRWIAELSLRS